MRHWRMRSAVVAVVVGLFAAPAMAGVVVRFDPPSDTVNLGDVFTIDIVADADEPIIGWGLDIDIEFPAFVSIGGPVSIPNPPWVPANAPDGDGLAALASPFAPTNGSVIGNDILLATLTLSADAVGITDINALSTPGDLSEGFPRDGTGFAETTFLPATIEVVPEPAAGLLLVVGGLMMLRRRR